MNQFLTLARRDTPESIFSGPNGGIVEQDLLNRFAVAVSSQSAITPRMLYRLGARPRLAAEIISAGLISEADRTRMVSTPTIAFNVVAHRPSLIPLFLDYILSDPETAEQLYQLSRHMRTANGRPFNTPLPVVVEDILHTLEGHPRLMHNVLVSYDRKEAVQFTQKVQDEASQRRYESPGWSFQWLSLNRVPDNTPLDPQLLSSIGKSEMYCFLSLYLLRNRFMSPIVYQGLLDYIRTPRWAYHVLRHGLFLTREQTMEEILIKDPAWMVEYLVDTKASEAKCKNLYIKTSQVSSDHPLIADLHYWFNPRHKSTIILSHQQHAYA